MDEATARPWTARKPIDEDAAYIDGPGRFDLVARVASSRADATLIVEAVNAYDRLRAIEAAAREWRDAHDAELRAVAARSGMTAAVRRSIDSGLALRAALRAGLEVPSDTPKGA